MKTKLCKSCSAIKPVSLFYKNARSADGYQYNCTECQLAKLKEWRKQNPDKMAEISKRWNVKNKEKGYEYHQEWRKNNPDKVSESGSRYREKNREAILSRQRERRATDEYKEYMKSYNRTYRFRRYGLTEETYNEMLLEQSGVCAICLEGVAVCIDHDHNCCPPDKSCGRCVRGLLCDFCNVGISRLKEDVEVLRRAIEYLERR